MNSVFATWTDFLNGDVFPKVKVRIEPIRRLLRSTNRKILRTTLALSVGLSVGTGMVYFRVPSVSSAIPLIVAQEDLAEPSPFLRMRFRGAREYLGLTQVEAAKMLRVSDSSVEKFEGGSVTQPSSSTTERYLALIRLADLYRTVVGTKAYLVRAFLRTSSYYYDDKSAIDFAASRESGIFDVVGTERRKYA